MSARDPVRLTDPAAQMAPAVASALSALRARRADPADVRELAERLARELAAPSVAGSELAGGLWVKTLLGGVLTLALGFAAWHQLAAPAQREHAGRPTQMAAPAAEAIAPRAAVAQPDRAPALPVAPPSRRGVKSAASAFGATPRASPPPATRTRPTKSAPAAARPHPEREIELLQRAQAALDADPATTLALAREHLRAHPDGVFAQERELLAIEALLKLRQRARAVERAQAFVQRFPASPHGRRVRALLERSHSRVPATTPPASSDPSQHPEP
ncbi:MAG TPA: hypothetical protein VK524_01520 [Polyangiaceae bacterium]|nr:hypothetical protein [Polyangiaceae bacterium]